MRLILYISILAIILTGCAKKKEIKFVQNLGTFDPSVLTLNNPVKQVRGQTLYLPIYSNIPYHEGTRVHNLSGFVAVHNTDFKSTIKITQVFYFNNDGKLVKNFLDGKAKLLKPLETTNFFIPASDTSGVGANFILEWLSDSLVNEPLIESVMVSLQTGQGISLLSKGQVLNEIK